MFVKDFNQQLPPSFLSEDKKWKGMNKQYKLIYYAILSPLKITLYWSVDITVVYHMAGLCRDDDNLVIVLIHKSQR